MKMRFLAHDRPVFSIRTSRLRILSTVVTVGCLHSISPKLVVTKSIADVPVDLSRSQELGSSPTVATEVDAPLLQLGDFILRTESEEGPT